MEWVIGYLWRRPMMAAGVAAFSIVDALNCVRLGHDDWWFPAAIAFLAACLVRPA